MSTEAFSETLQFITNVKLEELGKRRQKYANHSATVFADANAHGDDDLIARVTVLIDGMKAWPGVWSANLDFENVKRWLEQAKHDPGFPRSVLQEWISQAEAQIVHEQTRYDFARLFGNLLNDWLESSKARAQPSANTSVDEFERVNRKETLEQKEKLETLTFEEKNVDVPALEAYLNDLFSSKDAKDALKIMRERMKNFSENMRKTAMTTDDVETIISSTLAADVLSEEKQTTLKEFKRNPTVIEELTSVLNMQREALHSWHWPQGGVLLEPRRHLNGKTRFYLDAEILTCLLLHYLGMRWAVEFRGAFDVLRESPAWKEPSRILTRREIQRRDTFLSSPRWAEAHAVDKLRQKFRKDHFFMCQLPEDLAGMASHYADDDSDGRPDANSSGPRFDTPVNLKQSLLHIISADVVFNKALYGQGTVVRTDLEWFGPSLPHQTIQTVLRFFGMPEEDLKFVQSFLSCPIVFKDDPSGLVRTRQRGVPISYMLSTLCGEASLFVMDFAVNQRANGLFLYRIYDDFWFWDKAPESCVTAWKEMNKYASLAGLTFNQEKTGSVCVGAKLHRDLPRGDVRWGFLKMDDEGRFVIDQAMIDEHIIELQRQLDATTSVFGWTQAYNKYMSFVVRNCGEPAFVYGRAHIDGIIDTLARMQRVLFPDPSGGMGGFVGTLAKMLESKFGVDTSGIPLGFYLWPNAVGGLEVKDPLVDLFLVRDGCKETPEEIIKNVMREDEVEFDQKKQQWEDGEADRLRVDSSRWVEVSPSDPFMSFEEFLKGREQCVPRWGLAYQKLLQRPGPVEVTCTPELEASLKVLGSGIDAFGVKSNAGSAKKALSFPTEGGRGGARGGARGGRGEGRGASRGGRGGWGGGRVIVRDDQSRMTNYWKWVVGLHHQEMTKKFGSLAIVDPNAVPVGMVAVFKSSRMKWEQ